MTVPHYSSITRELLRSSPITPSPAQQPRSILRRPTQTTTTTAAPTTSTPRTKSHTMSPRASCCSYSTTCIDCLAEHRRRQDHRSQLSLGHGVVVLNVEPERRHRRHETRYVEREVRKVYYNRWGQLVAKTYTVLERV